MTWRGAVEVEVEVEVEAEAVVEFDVEAATALPCVDGRCAKYPMTPMAATTSAMTAAITTMLGGRDRGPGGVG